MPPMDDDGLLDVDEAARLTGEQLMQLRAALKAQDKILEYEELKRLPIGMMTPEQMARSCDLAREQLEIIEEPSVRAGLEGFIKAIDEYARENHRDRKITGVLAAWGTPTVGGLMRGRLNGNGSGY